MGLSSKRKEEGPAEPARLTDDQSAYRRVVEDAESASITEFKPWSNE